MQQTLNWYKLGLSIIGLFTIVLLMAIFVQAIDSKKDHLTYKQATSIADKLSNYIDLKNSLPDSLAVAGVRITPATISYQKLSATSYKFCANYEAASTDSSVSSIASELVTGGRHHDYSSHYTSDNYLYIDSVHHKGKNCQTIKPEFADDSQSDTTSTAAAPPYTKNSDGSYTVCGVVTNYFEAEGHVTQGVTAISNSISTSTTYGPYVGLRQLYLFSTSSRVFDEHCQSLTPGDLHVGDTVDTFDITSPNAEAVTIFLKRSY